MSRLLELEDKAKRKLKGQRVWCKDCAAFKYCSQVQAYGKPSGGNVRYELTLNDCKHCVHGSTRDFRVLAPADENYLEIISTTSPFTD